MYPFKVGRLRFLLISVYGLFGGNSVFLCITVIIFCTEDKVEGTWVVVWCV